MEISRVAIRNAFAKEGRRTRLRAFAAVVFDDCFEVKNIRIIEGKDGKLFIVYPNKESSRPCPSCKSLTSYRDSFCRKCGKPLSAVIQAAKYTDLANPLTKTFAEKISSRVIAEYENDQKSHLVKGEGK